MLGLVLVLAGFFEWLGLPAQLNGLWFVLFLQPLVFALATLGRERRAERRGAARPGVGRDGSRGRSAAAGSGVGRPGASRA